MVTPMSTTAFGNNEPIQLIKNQMAVWLMDAVDIREKGRGGLLDSYAPEKHLSRDGRIEFVLSTKTIVDRIGKPEYRYSLHAIRHDRLVDSILLFSDHSRQEVYTWASAKMDYNAEVFPPERHVPEAYGSW